MKNLWKYLTILFAGMIAGIVAAIRLLDPRTINTSSYVEKQSQETKIGKVKQKNGTDNLQKVTQDPALDNSGLTRADVRRQRREKRKAKRKRNRS
ncbi:hypothetical protein [uncultured Sunxiuqinia sp.]|uniref:hypothetical protein n=1 Tax=uncultured Sunxiuqinia sp. TaxID=1573825 RepID=UPI00261F5DCC|nr:hypothetical protein [uncultured Sunxiuqinia sp.]